MSTWSKLTEFDRDCTKRWAISAINSLVLWCCYVILIKRVMRYKIKNNEIRSENAAKPASDAAAYLVAWLKKRPYCQSALDYGCGTLRYTASLNKKSQQLGIVDSEIQLTRTQKVHGKSTTVTKYVNKRWPSCRTHLLEHFLKTPANTYDFILCANVLSAIPSGKTIAKSLRAILDALKKNGKVLFVNQHRNSYFKEVQKKPTTKSHLYGWITNSNGRYSYYGILDKKIVSKLVKKNGFRVVEAWNKGESNYVLAERELR